MTNGSLLPPRTAPGLELMTRNKSVQMKIHYPFSQDFAEPPFYRAQEREGGQRGWLVRIPNFLNYQMTDSPLKLGVA